MAKAMTPWEPFGELTPLRNVVDRLFQESFVRPSGWPAAWEPGKGAMSPDVCEDGDNLIVKAALPGLKPEEANIQVQGDILLTAGQRPLIQGSQVRR